jgi:hypothetical protein
LKEDVLMDAGRLAYRKYVLVLMQSKTTEEI